jgi:hypothetical protein
MKKQILDNETQTFIDTDDTPEQIIEMCNSASIDYTNSEISGFMGTFDGMVCRIIL